MDEFLGERMAYERAGLEASDLLESPLEQLRRWLADAEQQRVVEPTAMALATATSDGQPSVRMVLLRSVDHGLVFFTNYDSQKGRQLVDNPCASVVFWWAALERQVRVEGRAERIGREESIQYFAGRPRESQLASAASPQSRPVGSREELEAAMVRLDQASPGQIACPEAWGGFRIIPSRFEFWQGRPARLHDRFAYEPSASGWSITRLAP